MKYDVTITINLPRKKVIALFDDPKNLKEWLPGLETFELVSGKRGQVGAKSKIVMNMGKNKCEMTEVITVRNLPHEFSGIYETKGMWNECKNFFKEENGVTSWTSSNEFIGHGFFMKAMVLLLPFMFKKQTKKQMETFKAFAEGTK